MSVGAAKIWSVAAVAAALFGAGSVALVHQQWRGELAGARRAGTTSLAQLAPLLEDELRSARYADVPDVVKDWGAADPTIARIRVAARSGYPIAEFARGDPGDRGLSFEAPLSYGYGGEARVTLVTEPSAAIARRDRLAAQLGVANLVIDASIVVVALLLILNRKAVRRYRTVSAINQTLLGGGSTAEFLRSICAVAVSEGGYRLAWIGLGSIDRMLPPTAVAGPAAAYAEGLRLSSDPSDPDGGGPAEIAMREQRAVFNNDFGATPQTAPWAARARRFGIRSSAALPLVVDGRTIGILGLYSSVRGRFDATEQALAEQMAGDIALGIEHQRRGVEIERSRAQLRDILDGLQVFVSLATIDGVMVEINRAGLVAAGVDAGELIGRRMTEAEPFAYSPAVRERLEAALQRVARGEIVRYDDTLQFAGPRHMMLDLTFAPLRDASGRTSHIVASAVDISARAQLEARLQSESERNRLFLRSASDGVHILDDAGRVVEVSDSFGSLLGYRPDEMIGMHPSQWDARLGREQIESMVRRLVAGERLRFETVHRRKDGSQVSVEVFCNGFAIRGQHFAYCSARDLTEIKQLQRELLGAVASEQRRLGQELHDGLGQELTGATLIARALATRAERSQLPFAANLGDLADLISRCIVGTRRIVRGLSPLTDVGGDLAAALAELASTSAGGTVDVHFTDRIEAPIGLSVEARGHLFRIAQEAVQNALKHAGAHRIDISLETTAAEIVLKVEDDGIGLPVTPAGGSGYGMRTMRYRADAIGARLTLEARSGGGTVVACMIAQAPAED